MPITAVIVAVVVVVVIAALIGRYFTSQQRPSAELQKQFGPEYDHAIESYGERGRAQEVLTERSERVAALHINPLDADDSRRFDRLLAM